jgi:hypothetical protein
VLTDIPAKQIEKAYQKQHLFQNAKARGAFGPYVDLLGKIDNRYGCFDEQAVKRS